MSLVWAASRGLSNEKKNDEDRLKRASDEKCLYKKQTPLIWASGHGNTEVTDYLFKVGASITHQDCSSKTTLHWTVRCGHSLVLDHLLGCLRQRVKDKKGIGDTQIDKYVKDAVDL